MHQWKKVKLKDVCTKIGSGATPKGGKEAYLSEGISLIRSQNILDFCFSTNGLAFIDENQAKQLAGVTIYQDDVLLNITGDSVARVCKVPDYVLPARVNQHVAILRANDELLDADFLKYYLLNPVAKNLLLNLSSTGATRNALTKSMIEDFEIPLPPLTTQARIAEVLSSLDEKIELNRQTNQTLENIAKALFEEWFIKNENSSISITEYIKLNPRLSIKKDAMVKYVEMADLPTDSMSISNFVVRPFTSGSKYQNNDTLLARITPCLENGKTGFVDFLNENEIAFGSTEFIVMRAKEDISPFYVYCLARNENFKTHAVQSMVGSSGRQRIQNDMLATFQVPSVDYVQMSAFNEKMKPIFQKMRSNTQESQTLTVIRDGLLPKLMSGAVAV